jgi:hypothetical protein
LEGYAAVQLMLIEVSVGRLIKLWIPRTASPLPLKVLLKICDASPERLDLLIQTSQSIRQYFILVASGRSLSVAGAGAFTQFLFDGFHFTRKPPDLSSQVASR